MINKSSVHTEIRAHKKENRPTRKGMSRFVSCRVGPRPLARADASEPPHRGHAARLPVMRR